MRNQLAEDRCLFGTWSVLPSPHVVDVLIAGEVDFVVFDREHGPIGFDQIASFSQHCRAKNVCPIVRVPEISIPEIQRALDSGALGLHVPNVTTPQEIEQLIELSHYAPRGRRGFSPFTTAGGYGQKPELLKTANSELLLAVHIEKKAAVENLAQLLAFPEVDIFFVGLFDLANELGFGGDVNLLLQESLIEEMVHMIVQSGKIAGTIATTLQQAKWFMEMGFRYITYSVDCEVLLTGYKNALKELRKTGDICAIKS